MAVSVNSVIHYTRTLDNLKGIIADSFKIKYCLENVTGVDSAFPLVSFCDIPLYQVKNHMVDYGYYGIGLSKAWANKNNLNPVLYINGDSYLDLLLKDQGERINAAVRKDAKSFDWDWLYQYVSLLSFVKAYKGKVTINSIQQERIFYNEREWRYVPSRAELKANGAQPQIYGPNYLARKNEFNDTLKKMSLQFSIEDISYLIVDTDADVHEIIDHVKQIYKKKHEREIELLITKIFTKKQIFEDL